jgi:hypothetical protein
LKQYETKAETKKRKRERGGEKGRVDESKKKEKQEARRCR